MKLRAIVYEDLYYVEPDVSQHVGGLVTKKVLEKVVYKYATEGTEGVFDTKEELFTTDDGVELCIPEEYLTVRGVEK